MDMAEMGSNKLLSIAGIAVSRVAFPFAGGLNNFGSMAGLAVVAGFAYFFYSDRISGRLIGAVVVIVGQAGILLADSRAVFALANFWCLIFPLLFRWQRVRAVLKLFPLVSLVAPLLIIGIFLLIRQTGVADSIGREGAFAQRLGLLSGREVVWGSAIRVLTEGNPIQMIGYGSFGQYTSGATRDYSWIFSQIAGLSSQSLHNANLQIIIDIGYIGFAVWLVFWFSMVGSLVNQLTLNGRVVETTVPLAIVCFTLLSGILEVSGTPYFPDAMVVILFFSAWAMKLPPVRVGK